MVISCEEAEAVYSDMSFYGRLYALRECEAARVFMNRVIEKLAAVARSGSSYVADPAADAWVNLKGGR